MGDKYALGVRDGFKLAELVLAGVRKLSEQEGDTRGAAILAGVQDAFEGKAYMVWDAAKMGPVKMTSIFDKAASEAARRV